MSVVESTSVPFTLKIGDERKIIRHREKQKKEVETLNNEGCPKYGNMTVVNMVWSPFPEGNRQQEPEFLV